MTTDVMIFLTDFWVLVPKNRISPIFFGLVAVVI